MKTTVMFICLAACMLFFSCGKGKGNSDTSGNSELRLEYMEVKEPSLGTGSAELFLYGQFGDWNSSSSVRIGTNIFTGIPDPSNPNATILAWNPGLIWIRIPKADDPGGSGAVKITSAGKESNIRTLNVWTGVLIYNYPSGGTLREKCNINFILRADSKPYSNVPATSLVHPESSFARGSTVDWLVEGTASSPYCTTTANMVANSGTINWYGAASDNATLSENFQSKIQYLGSERLFLVKALKIHKYNASKFTITSSCGAPQQYDFHLTDMPGPLAKLIGLNIDPGTSAIKAGHAALEQQSNHVDLSYEGTPPNLIAEVRWDLIKAKYPNQ